jgi:hypothetical protein
MDDLSRMKTKKQTTEKKAILDDEQYYCKNERIRTGNVHALDLFFCLIL